ncbi:MAG TPA: ATP-binding cassette domain-containing protein, partial [Acidimicrobiia bacterium]|nr:ATP-binding cassette domain-containing protein [Acidimicrobiia bacterium]
MTSDERPAALAISRLSKHYGATTALGDVSLSVRPGQVHALLGANGSGKSTLVKVVAGVVRGDAGGVIELGAARIASDRVTPEWSRRFGLRVVHQDLALVPDLSVAENIALGSGFTTSRFGTIDRRALRTRATMLLDRFDVGVAPDVLAGSLEPADRAMVAIARALEDDDVGSNAGVEHRTLLLDEALAPLGAREVAHVL